MGASGCPDVGGSRCREGEDSSTSLSRGAATWTLQIYWTQLGHNLRLFLAWFSVPDPPWILCDIMELYGIWIDSKFLTPANSRMLLGMISQFFMPYPYGCPKLGEIYCSIIRSQKHYDSNRGHSQTSDG
jgi:hypothetical protein